MKNLKTLILFMAVLVSPSLYATQLTNAEVQKIAKDAYIFNYPLVMYYSTMYKQAIDKNASSYRGGFGKWIHLGTATPKDTDIVTPNNDTPYSYAWLDLRAEPWVLSLPEIDKNRFYTSQWDDLWGFVVDNAGSVEDGNKGGNFLIASPSWKGEIPKGINRVIQGETSFMGTLTRTQLFSASDMDQVIKIQNQYKLQPLSVYLGQKKVNKAVSVRWMKWKQGDEYTNKFWDYVNFLLPFTTAHPEDNKMLENMAKIGLGKDAVKLSKSLLEARDKGLKEGIEVLKTTDMGKLDPFGFFTSRKHSEGRYLNRALGTYAGLFGNVKEISVYKQKAIDNTGKLLNGSKHQYSITFSAENIPPAKYFWSATMYKLPERLLVENPIKRYSIGSASKDLKKDKDGLLTLYFQSESPGKEKESNWLPAPKGPFWVMFRMYGPGESILNKTYTLPDVKQIK